MAFVLPQSSPLGVAEQREMNRQTGKTKKNSWESESRLIPMAKSKVSDKTMPPKDAANPFPPNYWFRSD